MAHWVRKIDVLWNRRQIIYRGLFLHTLNSQKYINNFFEAGVSLTMFFSTILKRSVFEFLVCYLITAEICDDL